jgi:thiol-disulfide isomerase/thioredoxin
MKLLSKYIFILCILLHFNSFCLAEKITTIDNLQTPDDIAFFNEKGDKCFLDQYEGKTILLVFWATWCSSCVKEMPDLDLLQKDFRKLPFEVIAVSQDFQGISILKDFFKVHELRHLKIYHDYQNELFKAFAVIGLPTSYLINAEGRIVKSFAGVINWHEAAIRDIVLQHIPGNPGAPKNSYKVQDLNKPVKSMIFKKDGPQDSDEKAPVNNAQAPDVRNPEKNLQSQEHKDEINQHTDENKNELKNK